MKIANATKTVTENCWYVSSQLKQTNLNDSRWFVKLEGLDMKLKRKFLSPK
jgi:hypothetical protein